MKPSTTPASIEDLVVMSVGFRDFVHLSSAINLDGLVAYLNAFQPSAAAIISDFGGSLARSSGIGEVLAVWSLNNIEKRYPILEAVATLATLNEKNAVGIGHGFLEPKVTIGLSRGKCIVRRQVGEDLEVLADPVNRASLLGVRAREMGIFVLADKAVAESWPADFQELEPGVFSWASGKRP